MSEECPVCNEVDTLRVVPCGNMHSFCVDCINRLLQDLEYGQELPCPCCRCTVRIPPGGLTSLPISRPASPCTTNSSASKTRLPYGAVERQIAQDRELAESLNWQQTHQSSYSAWSMASGAAAMNNQLIGFKLINHDMTSEMQLDVVRTTILAIQRNIDDEYKIAEYLQDEFEKKYGGFWSCVVGSSFTASFRHSANCYICFDIKKPQVRIMLFKNCGLHHGS